MHKTSLVGSHFIVEEGVFDNFGLDELQVFHCRFSVDAYCDQMFAELGINFPPELSRAVPKRRAEYLAGRYCAKKALALAGGPDADISADKNRCPLWPAGFIGSITHTSDTAFAAVCSCSTATGIGIDSERDITPEIMKSIIPTILCGEERNVLLSKHEAPERMFTLAFSIKESFFKATFPSVGFYFDFDAVEISSIEHTKMRASFQLKRDLLPIGCVGQSFEARFLLLPEEVVSLVRIQ